MTASSVVIRFCTSHFLKESHALQIYNRFVHVNHFCSMSHNMCRV